MIENPIINTAQTFQLLSFEPGKNVRVYCVGNNAWFSGRDVAAILGYSDIRKAVRNHVCIGDKITINQLFKTPLSTTSNNEQNMTVINQNGISTLFVRSRIPGKERYLLWFRDVLGLDCSVSMLYKEQETVAQIRHAFKHIPTLTQYRVGPYRIDLYFPNQRLAIECDEHGHTDRVLEYEITRQEYIENALKCKFIRYNPDQKDFSIFDVISTLMLAIYIKSA